MIGDTASISLLTGLPGSGKTLRIVQRIVDLVAAGNLVFTCNITDISVPGVMPFDDPRKWEELPAGAILFVDEAQAFFRARRAGEPPSFITAMSTIRHHGIRLVLATQQPDYLDSYVRGLVGFHEHLYRSSGGSETFIFRNHQVMEQIRLPVKRIKSLYDYQKWALPKEYFSYYKSSELHTVKYRMPSILKKAMFLGPLSLVGLVGAFIGVYFYLTPDVAQGATESAGSAPPTRSALAGDESGGQKSPKTLDQYVQQFVPRVHSQPWSAPLYDEAATPAEIPRVFCMIGGDREAGTCTCITDQGTKYWMDTAECRIVAVQGQYEPFLRRDREHQPAAQNAASSSGGHLSDRAASVPAPRSAVGVGVAGWQGQQTRYGQFRGDPIGGDPVISN